MKNYKITTKKGEEILVDGNLVGYVSEGFWCFGKDRVSFPSVCINMTEVFKVEKI